MLFLAVFPKKKHYPDQSLQRAHCALSPVRSSTPHCSTQGAKSRGRSLLAPHGLLFLSQAAARRGLNLPAVKPCGAFKPSVNSLELTRK